VFSVFTFRSNPFQACAWVIPYVLTSHVHLQHCGLLWEDCYKDRVGGDLVTQVGYMDAEDFIVV
jgi:hypothetical protein